MHFKRYFAGACFLALAALCQAETQSVATSAKAVTVYPAGAKVLRLGQADLPAGAQTILFEGLPAGLKEESLRLKVEGPQGTTVYGMKLKEAFSDQEQARRRAELQEKVQALEDQKTDLADRISSRKAEAEILKALAEKSAGKAESAARVSELAASVESVGKRLDALAAAARKDERAQRELDKKLAALKSEMSQAGPGGTSTRVVEADLELAEAGACRFELAYFVDQASWTPRYDLRLRASDKEPKVELDFLAEIRQLSGEDWNDVALTLSTARPTADSQVPDPTQWWLDFEYARPVAEPMMDRLSFNKELAAGSAMAAPAAEAAPDLREARVATAAVQDLGPATLFVVKRRASVASAVQGQRVSIAKSEQAATLLLVAVPRLSNSAFLEAKIAYKGEQPLLPGPAQLFRDNDLAGQVQLMSAAPGESFSLGFGMDEHIKVSRKRRAQKEGNDLFGIKGRMNYDWDIKVANYHDGVRDIEVREQLPRSRQEAIRVKAMDTDPKPAAEDPQKPGLIRWNLELKQGEEKTMRLRYEVSWPEGQKVSGLE